MSNLPQDPASRQAAQRRAWSQLAADAARYADRLIETDGEQAVETVELRGLVRSLTDQGFPSNDASARMAADGFVRTTKAMLTAARPRRRVILANAVLADARAIGELLVDVQDAEALAWRALTGEA